MHPFRRRTRPIDPEWEVASATQILAADAETVSRLAREAGVAEQGAPVEAVLIAVRHPTGWFVHAVRRDDLIWSQVELLRELVTVRTYLLLTRGPESAESAVWRRGPGAGEWRSVSFSLAGELADLDDVPVD